MGDVKSFGLVDRLRTAWRDIKVSARERRDGELHPDLPEDDAERLRAKIADCLEARGGEVSARARSADLGRAYLGLTTEGRGRFLAMLADEFGTDDAEIDAAVAALREADGARARLAAKAGLRDALIPRRRKLFTQFTGLPNGVKFLVDMRAEALALARANPGLKSVADDLEYLFSNWFDVGFLDLEQITWQSPAALLEKLIAYEAVHAIHSWDALKKRLADDRRCFAFFHPRMPDEPLIFVEVALVDGMAGEIGPLIDETAPAGDPRDADTAIFYSISNAQTGLAGISFGNFLIKRVVDELTREFPGLKTFATLSPIPGFRVWLDAKIEAGEADLLDVADARRLMELTGTENPLTVLRVALETDWSANDLFKAALEEPLMGLCARYLALERGPTGRALDPVARFHLRNGSRVERINWLGDTSEKGLAQAAGIMVNYNYRLADIEENHEDYVGEGKVAIGPTVKSLLGAQAKLRRAAGE
jgi:malonyl-CoA decarboxylase